MAHNRWGCHCNPLPYPPTPVSVGNNRGAHINRLALSRKTLLQLCRPGRPKNCLPKAYTGCTSPGCHACQHLHPASLCQHVCTRAVSGVDSSGRNTGRCGAETAGAETYLQVLEGLLGRQVLTVAHRAARILIAEGPGNLCVCVFFSFFFCC